MGHRGHRDAAATRPQQVAAPVTDNLALIAGFTARPTGDTSTVDVATTEPERQRCPFLEPSS